MSYHVMQTAFKELPKRIIVRKDGYMDAYKQEGIPITDYVYVLQPTTKGDCTICTGWVDDGRGGTCVFTDDFWTPHCPYDKEVKR